MYDSVHSSVDFGRRCHPSRVSLLLNTKANPLKRGFLKAVCVIPNYMRRFRTENTQVCLKQTEKQSSSRLSRLETLFALQQLMASNSHQTQRVLFLSGCKALRWGGVNIGSCTQFFAGNCRKNFLRCCWKLQINSIHQI